MPRDGATVGKVLSNPLHACLRGATLSTDKLEGCEFDLYFESRRLQSQRRFEQLTRASPFVLAIAQCSGRADECVHPYVFVKTRRVHARSWCRHRFPASRFDRPTQLERHRTPRESRWFDPLVVPRVYSMGMSGFGRNVNRRKWPVDEVPYATDDAWIHERSAWSEPVDRVRVVLSPRPRSRTARAAARCRERRRPPRSTTSRVRNAASAPRR